MNEQEPMTNGEIEQQRASDEPTDVLTAIEELELGIERLNSLKFDIFHVESFKAELRGCIKHLVNVLNDYERRISKLEAEY